MIKFKKPINLNGEELTAELRNQGIQITEVPFVDEDNNLWLAIDEANQNAAKAIVESHNGKIIPSQPTVADKLASVGLKLEDLKSALGF